MKKIKIVIVGGGFGGVYTALNLTEIFNDESIEVTLINKNSHFLFTPLLHEVATGGLSPNSVIEPLREVFRGTSVRFSEDSVIEIDYANKMVRTGTTSFYYDYLVIATGADTNHFGITGAKEHCFKLKTLEDAIVLRKHILETCEIAVNTKNKDLLTTAIVGAGPTGVELAAEFIEYMQHTLCTYYKNSGFTKEDIKVNLLTTTPDIISQFPQDMRDIAMTELNKEGVKVLTNTIVTKVEPNLLTFKDGGSLKAHTIVWVAGVAPYFNNIKGITDVATVSAKNRIETNEFLQSTKYPEVFSLGDVSGTSPMLAQVAVQQGKVVAENIYALVDKKELMKFEFKQKGLLISIGQWYAIGNFKIGSYSFTLKGRLMWWIWRTVYLFNFLSWKKRFEIAGEWTLNLFYPRDIGREGF
jgi:NADH dehydrogenase